MPENSLAAETRVCTKCGVERLFPGDFHHATPYTPGKERYHSWCRQCKNADRTARTRTPLGRLRNHLHTNRWRLRHVLRETTRRRLVEKVALLEREIEAAVEAKGVDA
jgi:hypothetical protein